MSRSKKKHPSQLSDIVSKVLETLGGGKPSVGQKGAIERLTKETIEEAWRRLAGMEAARHSWPVSLSRGRLLVEVENSGWMYTLGMKKEQLLQGLIELFGVQRVKELSFRMGERENA